jgi:hypothetical protein
MRPLDGYSLALPVLLRIEPFAREKSLPQAVRWQRYFAALAFNPLYASDSRDL